MAAPHLSLRYRGVGAGESVLIVAECGINHNGSLDLGLRMIEEAALAGVGACKFQLFRAAGMYTPEAGLYRTSTGEMVPIFQLMQEMEVPEDWVPRLSAQCHDYGLEFIMTVCDEWCVDFMTTQEFEVYKVASYEIGHLPMLRAIAAHDKPIFISTGAATMAEVAEAVATVSPDGQRPVVVCQCTAHYPAEEDQLDLAVLEAFAARFAQVIPGFSDHSRHPTAAPVQAVYHGAKVIEKHFTLDRDLPGADHSFACEPPDLARMVAAIREAEARLASGERVPLDPILSGRSEKQIEPSEEVLRAFAHRGLFTVRDIPAGEAFGPDSIHVLRPGELPQGLHPRHYQEITAGDRTAARDLPAWHGLQWEDVDG